MRLLLLLIGFLSLGLGLVGIFIPLLPTTPFLILAAICFSRSSPKLETYLLQNKFTGPTLTQWREKGAIGWGPRILASLMLASSAAYLYFYRTNLPTFAWIGFGSVTAIVLFFIWTRPLK